MKYLNTLTENNPISSNLVEEYRKIKEKISSDSIDFSEDEEFMVSNHLICLLKRIESNEFVDEIDESLMEEISNEIWQYTESLIKDSFEKYERPINKSEVFLLSTHFQMNHNRKENNHG